MVDMDKIKLWVVTGFVPLVTVALVVLHNENYFVPPSTLSEAIEENDTGRVRQLLREGAELNAPIPGDKYHRYPVHLAADANRLKMLKWLIDQGANFNTLDDNTWTPLHYASYNENAEMIDYLLIQGTEVDAEDSNGRTALHVAAIRGSVTAAQTLVFNGHAALDRPDLDGMRPLQYSYAMKHSPTLVKMLEPRREDGYIPPTPPQQVVRPKNTQARPLRDSHSTAGAQRSGSYAA